MAGDEALVVLKAEDLVTGPTTKAIESLDKFQATVGKLSDTGKAASSGAKQAAEGLGMASKAANEAKTSNEVANQAMRLVTLQLGDMAGASSAARGGLAVLSTTMSQVLVMGKALSPAFLALTLASSAAATAFKVFSEDTKKAREESEALAKKNQEAVLSMNYLGDAARGVAAVGAAEMGKKVLELKDRLGEAEEAMRKLQDRASKLSAADTTGFEMGAGGEPTPVTKVDVGPIQTQVEAARKSIVNLKMELVGAEKSYDNLTKASRGQGEAARASGRLIIEAAAQQRNELNSYIAQVERASQTTKLFADFSVDGMNRVKQAAADTGASWTEMVEVAKKQTDILNSAVIEGALMMGQALGNVVAGNKDAWRTGLRTLIGYFFDAATQIVLASAIVNKAISAMLIPFGFGAILGLAAGLQIIKVVAMNALGGATSAASGAGSGVTGGLSSGAGAAASGKATTGGQALATSQREVTNNISINLPVQALDLASISEIQMKAFASRIGRAIREAAATGQFSTSAA